MPGAGNTSHDVHRNYRTDASGARHLLEPGGYGTGIRCLPRPLQPTAVAAAVCPGTWHPAFHLGLLAQPGLSRPPRQGVRLLLPQLCWPGCWSFTTKTPVASARLAPSWSWCSLTTSLPPPTALCTPLTCTCKTTSPCLTKSNAPCSPPVWHTGTS